jgi:hypothetical protein
MPHLTDTDRQALRLADELQRAVQQWLSRHGADPSCTVSPFVDAAGQPAVLMKLNAQAAWALIDGLHRQPEQGRPGARPVPGGAPEGPGGRPAGGAPGQA